MRTPWKAIFPIIGLAFVAIQTVAGPPKCTVPRGEQDVYAEYFHSTDSPPNVRVLVIEIEPPLVDLGSINLQLAANGRGIPLDVRQDFTVKNKAGCAIELISGIEALRFISKNDEHTIFKNGWSEFRKKFGKNAEIVELSRVGFSADRSLALLHVSTGIGPMAAGGTLYLFERKNGRWTIKTQIATWTT